MIKFEKINDAAKDIINVADSIYGFYLMENYVDYLPPLITTAIPLGYKVCIEEHSFATIFVDDSLSLNGIVNVSAQNIIQPFDNKELSIVLYNTKSHTIYIDQNKPLCYIVIRPLKDKIMGVYND